jgi:hypothetical protein
VAQKSKQAPATVIDRGIAAKIEQTKKRRGRPKPRKEDRLAPGRPFDGGLPPEERAKIAAQVAKMVTYNPGGYEDRLDYADGMHGSGKGVLVKMGPSDALREQVARMVTGLNGSMDARVVAGALGVPRAVFDHWMEVGRLSIEAFGHKAASLHTQIGPYVRWHDALFRARDAAEMKLMAAWIKKAEAENGGAMLLALAKYIHPSRFESTTGSAKEPPAAQPDGDSAGPVRFFLPMEDEMKPPEGGSVDAARGNAPLVIELDEEADNDAA